MLLLFQGFSRLKIGQLENVFKNTKKNKKNDNQQQFFKFIYFYLIHKNNQLILPQK